MIPRIICYIFGHKRYDEQIKGTSLAADGFTLIVNYYYQALEKCPRCGNDLSKNKEKGQ